MVMDINKIAIIYLMINDWYYSFYSLSLFRKVKSNFYTPKILYLASQMVSYNHNELNWFKKLKP